MEESHCKTPVMVSFQSLSGSRESFKLVEVDKNSSLESILVGGDKPEDWTNENIRVKVSSARSGSYDNFTLKNTVSLVARILKTDVIWVVFGKVLASGPVQR